MPANEIAKVSVCVEDYFGIFSCVWVYLSKMKKMVTFMAIVEDEKKNSSKTKDGQIKKLQNMCIYIFFPKVAFWEMVFLHKPALQKAF